ncbi:MAG TPA: SusF/SusE family outer membrane protein [Salinivirgaceae bacterium]|nr:SusF/SusE family outer membrane protein [Salinivirgaceae bacterium]
MKRTDWTKWMKMAAMVVLAAAITVSCKDDDDDDNTTPPAEDGVYLTGSATGLSGLDSYAMMQDGRTEGEGFSSNLRPGMFEKMMYLTTGDLKITEKAGAQETVYGVDAAPTVFEQFNGDDVEGPVYHAAIVTNGQAVSITEAGFYHVIFYKPANHLYYVKINDWGVIGDATDLGWSGQYNMTPQTQTATECTWKADTVIIRERGGVKFRYNNGWKIKVNDTLVFFGNIGRGDNDTDYRMGGGTWSHTLFAPNGEGKYSIILKWRQARGWSFTSTQVGTVDPLPTYPDSLFIIGSAVGGWDWAVNGKAMIPVHSKPHLFWRIQWLEGGQEFKFSPVRDWNGDFYGVATDTVGLYAFATGGNNIIAPAQSGYYMIVVNLQTQRIAVTDPKVYLIGNTVGSGNTADPNALFTVDNANEKLTLTKDLTAGELRMYAWFNMVNGWFTDWWQSEFIILNNQIVFRGNGPDQDRVQVNAGTTTIDLNFKTGAGSITQ